MHTSIRSICLDTCSVGNLDVKLITISCMYICIYVCMYVCIYVCMYVYVCMCVCVCVYVCMYVGIYVCMYVCMYLCMYVRVYLCMYVYMYVRMYVCIYVCIFVWMCVCMYEGIYFYTLITYIFKYLSPYILSSLYLINFCVFEAAYLLWLLLVFEFFPVISKAPLPSPSLVQNVRLLISLLLLSWCAKMSSSLWNAWFQ